MYEHVDTIFYLLYIQQNYSVHAEDQRRDIMGDVSSRGANVVSPASSSQSELISIHSDERRKMLETTIFESFYGG